MTARARAQGRAGPAHRRRELEPSHIDARLRSRSAASPRWELAGQDAPSIPRGALDKVELGIAEAIARALTPLRLAEGAGDGERGLAPASGSSSCSASHVADDAARATSGAGRAPRRCVRRSAARPTARCWLDLKEAAEDGMGPHGLLVGATGSGKSELLRSLVTGLARRTHPSKLVFRARRLQGRRDLRGPRRGSRTSRA